MPAAWEYEQAVNNVSNWFNTSADNVWANINQYNLTPEQVQGILPTVDTFLYGQGVNSGYTAVKAADGSVLSWNNIASLQNNSANTIEQAVNSNAGNLSQQTYQLPATTNYSGTGGTFNASKGVSGGIQGATNIMSQISAGVAAAGLGISLGKKIDSTLYNINPDFWDNHGMSTLNPEKWNSITADMSDSGWEGTVKRAFNAIFGLDPNTGKSQMYIDADAAAYLAMYMNEQGVFGSPAMYDIDTSRVDKTKLYYPDNTYGLHVYKTTGISAHKYRQNVFDYQMQFAPPDATDDWALAITHGNITDFLYFSAHEGDVRILNAPSSTSQTVAVQNLTKSGQERFYYGNLCRVNPLPYSYQIDVNPVPLVSAPEYASDNRTKILYDYAYILHHGSITPQGNVDGIDNEDGATQADFSNCEDIDDYKSALQTQFPSLFNNAITQNVAQPDGSVIQRIYIPVGTPSATGTQDTQPITDPENEGQSQSDTEVNPTNATQTIIETIIKYIENKRTPDTPDTPNPPDTGDGNTPPVVVPTGNAASLWAVYNPSQAQLNSFGAWLWSSNFIDQILKLFNNPMQSIIGVHKIFATPPTSGSASIKVGYLDSGVSANVVSAQYVTVDCGSVNVREQFGNVFDYEDTQIRLYLPFIGIVQLDTNDIMRGSVKVVYHVDVITGACLAEVRVTRDASGGTLYQFSGDAAVRYPISSGSYMGVVSGVLGVVGGIASGIMSGGATLPMAAGAIAGGLSGAKTQVQHSGSFAGNAGAMGAKKPYLIIERPQTAVADGYGNYQGKGANRVALISSMTGYFKMADIHTDSIAGAAESEIEAIRAALAGGVIA